MATATNQFSPDYAVPPGWILEERLESEGISHAEFARRCGRSPKLISEIISGKAPLEPESALQFERVLGVHASIWLGIEAEYRLHRARESEAEDAAAAAEWINAFPVRDLVKRGFNRASEDRRRCRLGIARILSCGLDQSLVCPLRPSARGLPAFTQLQGAAIRHWPLGYGLASSKPSAKTARSTTRDGSGRRPERSAA